MFLIQNNILRWPAFWILDRGAGVWENVGARIIDEAGKTQTIMYTNNDIRTAE